MTDKVKPPQRTLNPIDVDVPLRNMASYQLGILWDVLSPKVRSRIVRDLIHLSTVCSNRRVTLIVATDTDMLDEQLQLLGIQRTPTLDYATHFRVYQSFDDGEEISIPEQAVDVVYVKVDHAKDDEEFDVSTDKDVNGSDTDYDPLLPVPNGSPFGEVDVYPAIKIPETVPWGTPPPNNKDTYIPPAMQLDPWMVMGRFVETTSTWGEDLFKHMERGSNGLFTSVGCRGFVRGYVQNESTPLRVVRKEHKPELSAYLYRLGVGVEYAQQIGSILMRAADVVGARVATFDEIRRTNEYAVALVTLSGRLVVIERNVPKQQV